jgi:hypothetical protein
VKGKIRLWLLHIAVIDGIFFPDVLISRWSWRINFEHGTLAIVENGVSNVATGNRLWEELDMVFIGPMVLSSTNLIFPFNLAL